MSFPLALRGYDRRAVDAHLAEVSQLVAELEATQLRDTIVQRALDEVGEQTSSILQRAHHTADEIAAHSRAQAEGRIQRAEREAEEIRRRAVEERDQLEAAIGRLREDRMRLIEEIRQMAEEVLGVADEALERMPEPEEEPTHAEQDEEAEGAAAGSPADDGDPTLEVAASPGEAERAAETASTHDAEGSAQAEPEEASDPKE